MHYSFQVFFKERLFPRHHFIGSDSHCINVGPGIYWFSLNLFGRHVIGCSGAAEILCTNAAGQSKIKNFQLVVSLHDDIGWVYIPVDDTALVRIFKGFTDLCQKIGC
jgi:hypothetical protein